MPECFKYSSAPFLLEGAVQIALGYFARAGEIGDYAETRQFLVEKYRNHDQAGSVQQVASGAVVMVLLDHRRPVTRAQGRRLADLGPAPLAAVPKSACKNARACVHL